MRKTIFLLLLLIVPIILSAQSKIEQKTTSVVNFDISIHPNPATNFIYVNSKNLLIKEIEVYNVLGKLVLKTEKPTNSVVKINTSNLNRGVYLIKISNKDKSVLKKVILN